MICRRARGHATVALDAVIRALQTRTLTHKNITSAQEAIDDGVRLESRMRCPPVNARVVAPGTAYSCLAATLANKVSLFHKTGFSTGGRLGSRRRAVSARALCWSALRRNKCPTSVMRNSVPRNGERCSGGRRSVFAGNSVTLPARMTSLALGGRCPSSSIVAPEQVNPARPAGDVQGLPARMAISPKRFNGFHQAMLARGGARVSQP